MAHGLDVVLRAAQILKSENSDTSVVFLIAGDGAEKIGLEENAREKLRQISIFWDCFQKRKSRL
jgi:hypothetical protein